MNELSRRIQVLEDREAIRNLVVEYCFAVDDRRFDELRAMFTEDAVLSTARGQVKGSGIDEIAGYYERHVRELGVTNHFVHGHTLELDADDRDRATGLVSAHAELWRDGKPMITALRYGDEYRRTADGWRFRKRTQSYMYFVDVREYAEALGSNLPVRAAEGRPAPADWPDLTGER